MIWNKKNKTQKQRTIIIKGNETNGFVRLAKIKIQKTQITNIISEMEANKKDLQILH